MASSLEKPPIPSYDEATASGSVYDISIYLLDKSHISDTLNRMLLNPSTQDSALVGMIYTPQIYVDCDPVLVGRPKLLPREEWARRVASVNGAFASVQYVLHNLLVNLPDPDGGAARPGKCTAVALTHGYFYDKNSSGLPETMMIRQGERYEMEFTRSAGTTACANGWRLSKLKVSLEWRDVRSNHKSMSGIWKNGF